ncbi:tRNA (adenosine(37)-N6)-threonylcarbamoyltransferase complex ATPase subunit type 1 TsaE [Saccharibacillus sp. O23]|uniref:tRNA (adenosine(37)-N6)-threonylcarbamoyltransferase complex ATPase subunit type 1 TsaE n=1 Tax=Saccharibacillus sp. O23 TaxID=2009338 RepID=UPI000B4DF131|nr:tRNA (adenosine(37)-N6)-threonylcarbamoyltransferase complex ATPase subunit type 1 TsaE [Saccharibacillus sp. O23]OWR33202.1 tRNA (adenosine(37)-N6)-threonylcarbamoyltransferase complex ATPase subunit type 1 TsaE [Saccharibacillus sp. O23]
MQAQESSRREWISRGEADTVELAGYFAELSQPGTVITLDGDLGAGKTRFSQGFAAALGVKGVVNSPTFTLIKEYQGRLPLYHMDVYRITQDEAEDLGLDEYFEGAGVSLVEWASLIPDLLPPARLSLRIEHAGENGRIVHCEGIGAPYARWVADLPRQQESNQNGEPEDGKA